MKRFLKIMAFISLIMTISPLSAKAYDVNIKGKLNLIWVDHEDYSKARPDEVTIPLYDSNYASYRATTTLTLKKEDATITYNPENDYTTWAFNVDFWINKEDSGYLILALDTAAFQIPNGYILNPDFEFTQTYFTDNLGIDYDNEMNIKLIKNTQKDIKFTAIFNDGDGRDAYRHIMFTRTATNASVEDRVLNSTFDRETNKIEELWELMPYLVSDPSSSNIYEKIKYKYTLAEELSYYTDDTFSYDVYEDEDGNIFYIINHEAKRREVPIKVNWLDEENKNNKRPAKIVIYAYNQKDELEDTIEITNTDDWNIVASLYENMKYSWGRGTIKYRFEVEDTNNYTFAVVENDGEYTINATYQEDPIVAPDIKDDIVDDVIDDDTPSNNELPVSPATYDNVETMVSLLVISSLGIGICTYKIKKKIDIK